MAGLGTTGRALLVLLGLATAAACLPPDEPPAAAPARADVFLVSIDTLRADHMSVYGYERDTTPFLRRLARAAVRFEHAYATSAWTAPSVVSMLTSHHPARHGVEHGVVAGDGYLEEAIPDALPHWAELLRQVGYETFGVVANAHLAPHLGFARGFDHFASPGFVDADRLQAQLSRWAETLAQASPRFVWVHLFDPHAPYTPREPWLSEYWPPERPRFPELADRFPLLPDYLRLVRPDSPELGYVRALYDAEIRHTDAQIEAIVEQLQVGPEDLLIVTADHGEEFLEHGFFSHGISLYQESVRIPLLLRLPGGRFAGRTVVAPVSLVDLLPTSLDAIGVPALAELGGRSLLPLLRGVAADTPPAFVSQSRLRELRAVVDPPWKAIRGQGDEPDRVALYHLGDDPGEERDRAADAPVQARRLARALGRHERRERARRATAAPRPIAEERLEQLRAMGYVP